MENKLTKFIKTSFAVLLSRFPVSYFSSILATVLGLVILWFNVELGDNIVYYIGKIIFVCVLGVGVFAISKIMEENKSDISMSTKISYLLIVLMGGFFIFPFNQDFVGKTHVIKAIVWFLMMIFMFTTLPFVQKKYKNENLRKYLGKLLRAFFVAVLFTIILGGGLSIALGAIDQLFSIYIDSKVFGTLWILVGGIVGIGLFLGNIPRYKDYEEDEVVFSGFIKVFSGVLSALLMVYGGILLVYIVKILLTWSWPEGMVSPRIIAFAVILFILTFLLLPRFGEKKIYTKLKIAYGIQIVFTIVMLLAVGLRIFQYGLTENRYLVFIVGLYFLSISLMFVFYSKVMKASFLLRLWTIMLFVIVVGPFSASYMSKVNQKNILEQKLQQAGIQIPLQKQNSKLDITSEQASEIYDSFDYFFEYHSEKSLRKLFPDNFTGFDNMSNDWEKLEFIKSYMQLGDLDYSDKGFSFFSDSSYYIIEDKKVINGLYLYQDQKTTFVIDGEDLDIFLDKNIIKLSGYKNASIDLTEFIKFLTNKSDKDSILDNQTRTIEFSGGIIFVDNVYFSSKEESKLNTLNGILVLDN